MLLVELELVRGVFENPKQLVVKKAHLVQNLKIGFRFPCHCISSIVWSSDPQPRALFKGGAGKRIKD